MRFSTKYGWHGKKKQINVRRNPWYGAGRYWRKRNKNERKRKAKEQRQFIKKCKEGLLTIFIIGAIILSVYIYLKNIN